MKRARIFYFDILKVIAIIFVLITHCNFSLVQRENIVFWFFIEMAVPIFLIVTGYNLSTSASNKKITSWKELYTKNYFFHYLPKILIPYCIYFVFFIILSIFVFHQSFSFFDVIKLFVCGGNGPGSYYVPLLVQIYIIFFFFYNYFFKRKNYLLESFCFLVLIQLIYEILAQKYSFDPSFYRLFCGRQLIFINGGIAFFFSKKKYHLNHILFLIGLFLVGIFYIFNSHHFPVYIFKSWLTTSMPVFLYLFPVFILGFFVFKNLKDSFVPSVIRDISNSTYYIFLFQCLYYHFFSTSMQPVTFPLFFFNVLFCLSVGILWCYIDKKCHKLFLLCRDMFRRTKNS